MKIVYCIRGTFNAGGMERVLSNKANYLAKNGYDLSIITTDQKGQEPYFKLVSQITCYDLDINYCDIQGEALLKKIISYKIKEQKHHKRLSQLLHELRADVVISMFDHDVAFLHKIHDGSRKVLEIHFSRFKRMQYNRKGMWKWVNKHRSNKDLYCAKRYDRFVVLTNEDKGYWGNLPNMKVIANVNSFAPLAQAALSNKCVIAVGRYDYQKGFDHLIHIWKQVNISCPDWRLDIFGHGPMKEAYEKLIQELGLESSICLRPPVKNIQKEYLERSLLVMTSRYEGFGMALVEAQACGLPVVAYACKCGPRDIITDGKNGFLIEEGDQKMMVEQMISLINNIELRRRMGEKGREMSNRFSEETIMQQWSVLFDELTEPVPANVLKGANSNE